MRSLTDDLRNRSEIELAEIIRLRPDTVDPVPSDLPELAGRLSSAPSVRIALDDLDRRSVEILAVLAAAQQPVAPAELAESEHHPELLLDVVQALWSRALLWGPVPATLQVPVHVATGARVVTEVPLRPVDLAALIPDRVVSLDSDLVDQMAGQHALAATTTIGQLCEGWSLNPPVALKAGGLGVRDLAAAAEMLQTDETSAAFWIQLGRAAELIGPTSEAGAGFAPTETYDDWSMQDLPDQWACLAEAWLLDIHDADRVGPEHGDKRLAALGPELASPGLNRLRRHVLEVLVQVSPGETLERQTLELVLADRLPRVPPVVRTRVVAAVLREAEALGVTAQGALSQLGRALLATPESVEEVARQVMPAPVDNFLAQADLTLVVPGPPSPQLRSLLNLVADMESTGGAAVYRVTAHSVARALDVGRSPDELLADLSQRSLTPIPQPMEYLVKDVSRRHGATRVGAVNSYVRSDDEAAIAAYLAHPRAASLGLVRLGSTVLVSRAPAESLLELAREIGQAPLAEGIDGSAVAMPRVTHRAAAHVSSHERGSGLDEISVRALVKALNRMESEIGVSVEVEIDSPNPLPRMATAQSATVLRLAHTDGHPVWVGYADNAGSTTRRLVDVVAMDAGVISTFDHSAGRIRTLALSRITGVERAAVGTPAGSSAGSSGDTP